jgi:large repetitive protein
MSSFSHQYKPIKPDKITGSFWLHLLQFFRLIELKSIHNYFILNDIKIEKVKLQNLFTKYFILLLLISGTNAMAQPYPNTGDHQVCLNATEPYGVVLNAGSTYAWSVTPLTTGNGTIIPGATANLISVNWTSVGTATLKVIETNASGCIGDPVTIIVTVNPLPVLVITNPSICGAATADLTAVSVTAGSTPGLTFTYWTDAAGTVSYSTPTTANAGAYYIKGTLAGGCADIKPVTVTTIAAPTVVITNPAVCGAGTADLTAASVTVGSTPGLTFTYWTDAAGTVAYTTPTTAGAGTYYIKGTLAGGCADIKPVTVTTIAAPTVVITNPAGVCGTGTVDLTAAAITAGSTAGLTYSYWADAAGTVPYTTPATAGAGTYYIRGTLAGGCADIKPVVVTAAPLPTPVITGPDPVCVSASGSTETYLTPNAAGHTYNWVVNGGTIASGQGTNQITVSWTTMGAGSVSVTETVTAGGCQGTVVKNVTVNPKPVTSQITHN